MSLHGDRVFNNSSGRATKTNLSFYTLFFSCKIDIYYWSLVPPREIRTTQVSSAPIKHKEFRNNIGINFAVWMNFISRITWKLPNGIAIMFVLPLYVLILIRTPFVISKICLASKFTTFIRLRLFSRFNPSLLAFNW